MCDVFWRYCCWPSPLNMPKRKRLARYSNDVGDIARLRWTCQIFWWRYCCWQSLYSNEHAKYFNDVVAASVFDWTSQMLKWRYCCWPSLYLIERGRYSNDVIVISRLHHLIEWAKYSNNIFVVGRLYPIERGQYSNDIVDFDHLLNLDLSDRTIISNIIIFWRIITQTTGCLYDQLDQLAGYI